MLTKKIHYAQVCYTQQIKVVVLLGCYATQIGSYQRFGTTYRPHLDLKDATDWLSENAGN